MIKKIFCESNTEENYKYLSDERKEKYIEFYKKTTCCPEEYIISIDVASPHCKDQCCAIRYSYEEYLKGNLVIEEIKYF